MKKLFSLFVLPTFFANTSLAAENLLTPNNIIGTWNCTIVYPDLNIKTIDKMEYLEDGTTFGIGYIFIKKDFVYETAHQGNWYLQKNILSENNSTYSIIPIHPDFTMKRLKKDEDYARNESRIYQNLLDGYNQNIPVHFNIYKFQENTFDFFQILANNQYQGACRKIG